MPVSTALTVIFIVQPTVKTSRVTYKVELVSHVNLDGLECIAKQSVMTVPMDITVSTIVVVTA